MLYSSLKPFEEGSVWFLPCPLYVSKLVSLLGVQDLFVFFFNYVKEVWSEAPRDEQHGTRGECFCKRGGIGWQPVQCSCSQSHWPWIWAVLQETDLLNVRNVQVSQKQETALRWLWTLLFIDFFSLCGVLYLRFVSKRCSNLEFCYDLLCIGLSLYFWCARSEFRHGSVGVIMWGFSGDLNFTLQKGE